jgi:hypothetical protein
MKRSSLVTVMLVIAAVMLAIGLFVAGSIWRGRVSRKPSVSKAKCTKPLHQQCGLEAFNGNRDSHSVRE